MVKLKIIPSVVAITINQKKPEPRLNVSARYGDCSFIAGASISAHRCAMPVAPSARPRITIISVKLGIRAVFLLNSCIWFFKVFTAEESALKNLSILSDLATPNNKKNIHTSATIMSTVIIMEYILPEIRFFSPSLNISNIAAWLAPPPIQLPAIVVIPRHTSFGDAPPTTSGAI